MNPLLLKGLGFGLELGECQGGWCFSFTCPLRCFCCANFESMVLENALVRGVVNSHLQVYCQTLQEHAQEFGVGGGGSGVARISSGCKTRMPIYFSSSCVSEIKSSTWNPLRTSVVVPADRRLHTAASMNQQEPFLVREAI